MAAIGPLDAHEITEAAALIATVFSERWRPIATAEFRRRFNGETYPTYIFAARDQGRIVGVAGCIQSFFSENIYGLCWVGVLADYRHQGIARDLIGTVENFIARDLLTEKTGSLILTDR